MKFVAWLHSIDEAAFTQCVTAPTDEQVECVAQCLAEWGTPDSPWATDPRAWVANRLTAPDWYSDLDVGEPDSWEGAVYRLIQRPEFDLKEQYGGATLDRFVVDWSRRVFALRNEAAALRSFKPYRYYLAEERELELTWWPTHAMVTSEDVGRMIAELGRFDEVVETLEHTPLPGLRPGFKSLYPQEIEDARRSIAQAVPVLEQIRSRGHMLFAPFEQ